MTNLKTIDVRIGTVTLRDDGIIHCKLSDDQLCEVKDRLEIISALEALYSGYRVPVVLEMGERVDVTQEARKMDLDDRINKILSLRALVITSLPSRIAARFYYKLRRIPFPVKTFSHVDDAVAWIHEQQEGLKKAN